MSDEATEAPIEPDAIDGVAAPRATAAVFGHGAAEETFLNAYRMGRLHHAWLLRGEQGVGKASFAYRAARFLLTRSEDDGGLLGAPPPPESLDPPPSAPDLRQIAAGAHPRLLELRRPWNEKTKSFRTAISVDAVRRMIDFFQLSAADGGRRVALIDPADELNTAAANALLKLIEEPPALTTFFLVSAASGRLPATIRSRCRRLDFRPLTEADAMRAIAAAAPELDAGAARSLLALTPGAPGQALRLHAIGGVAVYGEIIALLSGLPRIDRAALAAMMQSVGGKAGAERFAALARLMRIACERIARAGAAGPEAATPVIEAEAALWRRLAASPRAAHHWAEAATEVATRFDAAFGLNLDPSRSILDIAVYLEGQAQRAAVA